MAMDTESMAALGAHRFGFAPRTGGIAALARDPRGALLRELETQRAGQIADPALPSAAAATRAAFEDDAARRARAVVSQRAAREGASPDAAKPAAMRDASPGDVRPGDVPPGNVPPGNAQLGQVRPPPVGQQVFEREAKARFAAALGANIGFVERLVWFWSDHFCISADRVRPAAGAYEREAIRPHVLGRFPDMLRAVIGHPAMLVYLNNNVSIGPDSVAGLTRNRGLNENLAREVLELHTLGVDGGYTQQDVTAFARVLTGWTMRDPNADPDRGGEFLFLGRAHQPGPQRVMGRDYADTGQAQAEAVLDDLARHPATARHVATKLARHFVADTPPAALVDRLAANFTASGGNLKELAATLVRAPEAWEAPRAKLKRPGEWLVGILRAGELVLETPRVIAALNLLGEPLWRPPAPNGFPDLQAAWLAGMGQRLDVANTAAQRATVAGDPLFVLRSALGPLASRQTREALARAESRTQALTLLFMAPEFLRR